MTAKTAYTVDLQTKAHPGSAWQRTSWPVLASNKDNARTQAIEDARAAGYHAGECYTVTEGV